MTEFVSKQPILIRSLRQQIVDSLRNDLLCGRFRDGERLSEKELSTRFGVSRTPIREAFALLSQEGLLESQPNRGVRVAATPADAIRELIVPIRRTIESFALNLVFDDLNQDDFRLWDEIIGRLKECCKALDYDGTAENDIAFHRSIIRRTGEMELEAIWSAILARVRSHFWNSHRGYEDLMNVYREHRDIVDVFRSGDRESAAQALANSIS
jgi:DNA-binding GntR family transcriptional regulator